MNILLLGSGGRESALAWKIAQSPLCDKLIFAPGNGGSDAWAEQLPDVSADDFKAVADVVNSRAIDMVVVGPEAPLVNGIREYLEQNTDSRPLVVGPGSKGARLEGSKDFAKEFMNRHGIPTARHLTITADNRAEGSAFLRSLKAPYVIKADGLAAGKGVAIVDTLEEAEAIVDDMLAGAFKEAGHRVVIEEFLSGIECSMFVLTDGGGRYRLLPVAKDYKRALDGDMGPNTGGMGSVSPVPFADDAFIGKVRERIIEPTIKGLIEERIDYRGFIFLGLINVGGDPYVIEYNARMGDPETETVMRLTEGDLVKAMAECASGRLDDDTPLGTAPGAGCTVMVTSAGYPGSYSKGAEMNIPAVMPADVVLFHAGTKKDADGRLLTAGGRVIAVSATAPTLAEAIDKAYAGARLVAFEGATMRSDIGADMLRLLNA